MQEPAVQPPLELYVVSGHVLLVDGARLCGTRAPLDCYFSDSDESDIFLK